MGGNLRWEQAFQAVALRDPRVPAGIPGSLARDQRGMRCWRRGERTDLCGMRVSGYGRRASRHVALAGVPELVERPAGAVDRVGVGERDDGDVGEHLVAVAW